MKGVNRPETGALSPSYTLAASRLFCFRVTLDNLRQKKTDRIPAVRTVMSQWYSIQEESDYIMTREEIHTVLQPRNINHIGDPHAERDWECTIRLFPNNFFENLHFFVALMRFS